MEFATSGNVYCGRCEQFFTGVESKLTVQTDLKRIYTFCPLCLDLIPVPNIGYDDEKPIRIKTYHIDSRRILREIEESGEEGRKRSEYIKHTINTKRSEKRLDPIDF